MRNSNLIASPQFLISFQNSVELTRVNAELLQEKQELEERCQAQAARIEAMQAEQAAGMEAHTRTLIMKTFYIKDKLGIICDYCFFDSVNFARVTLDNVCARIGAKSLAMSFIRH